MWKFAIIAGLSATCWPLWAWSASPALENSIEARIQRADELQDKGSLTEAREIYESVLKTLPPTPPVSQLGHVLNGLSNVSSSLGDYQQAIAFAERANDVYHTLGDADGQAYALNNRGIAEGELGQYPQAQETLRRALELSRQAGDAETQVRTLNNLGNEYYFPGLYIEALRAYEDAAKIVEAHSAEKWSDYWRQITRFNEATLYQRLGRYQSALQIYKEIQTSATLSAGDSGHLFTNLGVLYRRLGDPWKALDAYRAALDLSVRQHDSVGEISALKNIGIVYALDQNDLPNAEKFFKSALSLANQSHNQREVMQANLYLGESKLREKNLMESKTSFQLALAQAEQLGTSEEQWKALYGLGKIEEASGRNEVAEENYRAAVAIIEKGRFQLQLSALRIDFLADKRDVYDSLIGLLLDKNDLQAAFSYLERSRARTLQDRLSEQLSPNESAVSKPLTLDEVRADLGPSTILMEYWVSGDRLALLWCTREAAGVTQATFSGAEKTALMNLLRDLPGNLSSDWRQQTAILSRLIPGGMPAAANARHLLIVPDGWLSSVPFDLVPLGDQAGSLLIERYDISYLPTAALIRRPAAVHSWLLFPWIRELVAYGDPEIHNFKNIDGGHPLGVFEAANDVQSLPYSTEEIHSIAHMTSGKSEVFLGASNRKTTFLENRIRGLPILHISTHAFADTEIPENSRLLFSSERDSGASYLFLRELYEMDLRDVGLATLSACDTERGKMIRGEGVQAFSRALLLAGTRSTVTTLWRVSDEPTSEFMKQFYYAALQQHQSKAEALRSAKLKFLKSNADLRNPAHWAAFILSGDGESSLPRFLSWAQLTAIALAAILIVAVAVRQLWGRRRVDGIHRT